MSRLVQDIETNHAVTTAQVQGARGRRNRTFDLAVALLFVPLYAFGAARACRPLRRRLTSESRRVRHIATGLASIAASIAGLQVGQLWLSVWEIVRVGNGHMSGFRAATYTHWSHEHVAALFVAAVSVFWVVASIGDATAGDARLDVASSDHMLVQR